MPNDGNIVVFSSHKHPTRGDHPTDHPTGHPTDHPTRGDHPTIIPLAELTEFQKATIADVQQRTDFAGFVHAGLLAPKKTKNNSCYILWYDNNGALHGWRISPSNKIIKVRSK